MPRSSLKLWARGLPGGLSGCWTGPKPHNAQHAEARRLGCGPHLLHDWSRLQRNGRQSSNGRVIEKLKTLMLPFITPFVGTTFVIDPLAGGQLGQGQLVTWGVHDGFEGPITPPSGNLILIEEPALGPPKPLWRYITPSLTTQFAVPELPEAAGEAGLGQGAMVLTVLPFLIEGAPLDFDDFTYNDLAQFRWKAWSTTTVIFSR